MVARRSDGPEAIAVSALEQFKRIVEKATGIGRPGRRQLQTLSRPKKPMALRFADDGATPNNPRYPVLFYKSAVKSARKVDPAAVLEDLFAGNGWGNSWRDGIYDHLHFHTGTHEVLGVARGLARVQLGGVKGKTVTVAAGDVLVLPAGTGHQRISASDDLLVVGAYPPGGKYDEPKPQEVDPTVARRDIGRAKSPRADPLFGADGPLVALWSEAAPARQARASPQKADRRK
jgi:uncharacterized protein YjlB